MKKWLCGIWAVILTMALCIPALAIVPPPANTYVGDYAGVLSDETEQHIIDQNTKLTQATGGAIVIVTVDFMDGMESVDYAAECFNSWQIGDKDRNNGLLLIYAVGENKVWAMPGMGIEDALDGSVLNMMLEDYFYSGYDLGEYDRATTAFFDAAYGWFDSYYGGIDTALQADDGYAEPVPGGGDSFLDEYHHNPIIGIVKFIFILLVLFVVLVVFDAFRFTRYRRRSIIPGMRPVVYRPIFFGRPHSSSRPSGSSFFSSSAFGGGSSRGGGAGRSGSSSRSSYRSSSRSSSHRSSGGFGGGRSRGGGAGR